MNPKLTAKDRGIIKGAIRRAFSRSELHKEAHERAKVKYQDPWRPRVKHWSLCAACKSIVPRYRTAVDHIEPVVPLDKTFEEMSLDELVNRMWCSVDLLQVLCETCHDNKTRTEKEIRKQNKKRKKDEQSSKVIKGTGKNSCKRNSTGSVSG